jgi:multiple sugar transport system permease protein
VFPTPIQRASAAGRFLYGMALLVTLIVWLLPLFAVMLTSVRSLEDLNRGNFWGRPETTHFVENYTTIFTVSPLGRFILNSFIITLPTVAGALALSCMAGYALARYRFRGSLLLFAAFIAGNFMPFQILMIPVRDLTVNIFGTYDTHIALIAFHSVFQTGFCTLFMRSFIRQLPQALIEAARLDGVGELKIFWFVVLPMVRPAIAALAVLVFTFVWNDFFWALVLVQSDAVRPVTAGLQSLQGMWLTSWQLISAASIVAALPPVLIFFVMQRHFVAGLTLGAARR